MTSRPSGPEQKQQLEATRTKAKKRQKAGTAFYVISSKWYKQWEEYTLEKSDTPPGKIDNSTLVEDKTGVIVPKAEMQIMKKDLVEDSDFVIITKDEWNQLHSW
jgi:hypothetical protein